MATEALQQYTFRTPISNDGTKPFTLCIEPWADEYTVNPESQFVVTFESDQPGDPEIVQSDDRLTIYGWTGCTKQVDEL